MGDKMIARTHQCPSNPLHLLDREPREGGSGLYEPRIYAVIYCSHILALRKEAKKCEGANTEGLSNWTVIQSETGCIKANMDAFRLCTLHTRPR